MKGRPISLITDADIDAHYAGGDWTRDPWFLRPESVASLVACDFTADEVHAAAEALARVYPPDLCRRFLRRWPDSTLVVELFHQVTFFSGTTALGVDLSWVKPWERAPDLVSRLRQLDQFAGAELEVDVWANLKRSRISAERPRKAKGDAQPDLHVELPVGLVQLEIKGLPRDEGEILASELHDEFSFRTHAVGFPPNGLAVLIAVSEPVRTLTRSADGRRRLVATKDQMFDALVLALEAVRDAGWPGGDMPVPGVGAIRVRPVEPGRYASLKWNLFEEHADPDYVACRAARLVRGAVPQFTRLLPAIIFLDVPGSTRLDLVHREVSRELARRPSLRERIDGIVLRKRRRLNVPPWRSWEGAVIRPRQSQLPAETLRRFGGLLASSPLRRT
jgi:hypothetical protein